MERPPLKDGYEYTQAAPSTEIRLIDPVWCPAGHPTLLTRRSEVNCQQHRALHHEWTCTCGCIIWRFEGAFVDELPCRR
jgi:hypothetical protein